MELDRPIARRTFLRWGSLSVGLLALSQLRTGAALAEAVAAAGGLRVMTPADARVMGAIAERMVFSGAAEMPRFSQTAGLQAIDRALEFAPEEARTQLPWALWLLEYSPLVAVRRAARFTSLAPADQDTCLTAWAESRVSVCQLAFEAFKNLSMLGYYSQDATWKGIHYTGPWVPRPRK